MSRDHRWIRGDGIEHAFARCATLGAQTMRIRDARERRRQRAERDLKRRRAAAVDGGVDLVVGEPGHLENGLPDELLRRTRRIEVVLRIRAQVLRESEKPRVLARAVVVQPGRAFLRLAQRVAHVRIARRLRSALQGTRSESRAREYGADAVRVDRFGVVRGQSQRDLGVGEAEAFRGAGLEQRQRLQALHGAARENRHFPRAHPVEDRPVRVAQDPGAAMLGFDVRAAPNAHEHRIIRIEVAARGDLARGRSGGHRRGVRVHRRNGGGYHDAESVLPCRTSGVASSPTWDTQIRPRAS